MDVYKRDNKIYFLEKNLNVLAYTDFDSKLWEVINATSWNIQKDTKGNPKYLRSSKYRKSLHQIVMIHWYGEDIFEEMKKRNFVIDHIDNNGFNCEISNLSFLYKNENTAKGLTYDIDRKKTERVAALNIFKDFYTSKFQITIGFNNRYFLMINGKDVPITSIKFLYNDDYIMVLNDAKSILHGINYYNKVNLSKLNYIDMTYENEILLELEECEKGSLIITRDGKTYLMLNEKQWITRVAPDKDLFNK
ncbi:hypothetical protein [Defluviitalea saccharophila]|uniref:HNH nuclease domain-containing protein n=1 Tax=Defluviitalea saccharophila TaxID=879970 RepID=A0ABZ2Y133_9FIRM